MPGFQFHKGTIKTKSQNRTETDYVDFNSIKVRLKLKRINILLNILK